MNRIGRARSRTLSARFSRERICDVFAASLDYKFLVGVYLPGSSISSLKRSILSAVAFYM
jgi:hypothetical protein